MTQQSVRLGGDTYTVAELYRKPKRALAAIYREHSGMVWSAVPPERWNKDELVNELLRLGDSP